MIVLISATPLQAADVASALHSAGLMGTWGPDCDLGTNLTRFSVSSSGAPQITTIDLDAIKSSAVILSAEERPPADIVLTLNGSLGLPMRRLVLRRTAAGLVLWESALLPTETKVVDSARDVGSGHDLPILHRCMSE